MATGKQKSLLQQVKDKLRDAYAPGVKTSPQLFPTVSDIDSLSTNGCDTKTQKYALQGAKKSTDDKGVVIYANIKTTDETLKQVTGDNVFIKKEQMTGDIGFGKPIGPENNEALQEPVIASRLNLLLEAGIVNGFSRAFDWFACEEGKGKDTNTFLYIVSELQKENLIDYLTPWGGVPVYDFDMIRSMLAQLFANLAAAQYAYEFVHYDLHAWNYMYRETGAIHKNKTWRFVLPNGREIFIPPDVHQNREGKIIDFGRSRMASPFALRGKSDLAYTQFGELLDPGIGPDFHSRFDTRRYAMHLVERLLVNSKGTYFATMKETHPDDYAELVELLNEMCGHSTAFGPDGGPRFKDYWDDLDKIQFTKTSNWLFYHDSYINSGPTNIPKKGPARDTAVNTAFKEFRWKGIELFMEKIVEEINTVPKDKKQYYSNTEEEPRAFIPQWASLMAVGWSYSRLQFAGRGPAALLEMTFFENFHTQPSDLDNVSTLMEYKSLLQLRLTPAGPQGPPGSPKNINGCVVCETPADYTCHRCDTRYCSSECQSTDWERAHHQLCLDIVL